MDEQAEKKLAANELLVDGIDACVRAFGATRTIKMLRNMASMLAPDKDVVASGKAK